MKRFFLLALASLALGSCDPGDSSGPVDVAVIGEPEGLFQDGLRLPVSAQHLRAATKEGLVALDPAGQIVPAIAERWIVTDDGLSYIFRLRDSEWPDGEPITAGDVTILLRDTIRRLDGTSLGLDLAKVIEVRAMTGRIIEFQLSGPMPEFLRLLAQPEMGVVNSGSGAGPMVMSRDEDLPMARLSALPPQERGLPAREDWQDIARTMTLRALPARQAVDGFSEGGIDLLINGTLANFPMSQLGPLSRGTIQVDPALGVFGLAIRNEQGLLADPARREALAMALDRADVIQPFGLGGWQASTWIVPPDLFSPQQYPDARWGELSIEERREVARQRVSAWARLEDEQPALEIFVPEGPGGDLLFSQISETFQAIGVSSLRSETARDADLALFDRLARYSSPRWFLNQFHCSLEVALCSEEADALVLASLSERDPEVKQALLAQAHSELVAREVFIPLGAPVRWSLVRGAVRGYQANQWGLHPLFPLSQPTI